MFHTHYNKKHLKINSNFDIYLQKFTKGCKINTSDVIIEMKKEEN
jgi:hypothetical protein